MFNLAYKIYLQLMISNLTRSLSTNKINSIKTKLMLSVFPHK